MSLLSRLLPRPATKPEPHRERRYYAATKAENKLAQRKALDRVLELAVYKATTTPEQRKQEADRFFASKAKARGAIREGRG